MVSSERRRASSCPGASHARVLRFPEAEPATSLELADALDLAERRAGPYHPTRAHVHGVKDDEQLLYNSVVLAVNTYMGAKLYQLYQMKKTADSIRENAQRLWEEMTQDE